MSRGVRPTTRDGLERLRDAALDAYIADTKVRIAMMTKAALRKAYENQLRIAEQVRTERQDDLPPALR